MEKEFTADLPEPTKDTYKGGLNGDSWKAETSDWELQEVRECGEESLLKNCTNKELSKEVAKRKGVLDLHKKASELLNDGTGLVTSTQWGQSVTLFNDLAATYIEYKVLSGLNEFFSPKYNPVALQTFMKDVQKKIQEYGVAHMIHPTLLTAVEKGAKRQKLR